MSSIYARCKKLGETTLLLFCECDLSEWSFHLDFKSITSGDYFSSLLGQLTGHLYQSLSPSYSYLVKVSSLGQSDSHVLRPKVLTKSIPRYSIFFPVLRHSLSVRIEKRMGNTWRCSYQLPPDKLRKIR